MNFEIHKWPDRLNWRFTAEKLGHDEHGTWLAVRRGSPFTGRREGELEFGFVSVVADGRWWIASFFEDREPNTELYVDITTPPSWGDGVVTAVDLDLDVVRFRDGRVELIDEDEFEEHQVKYGYPSEIVERARSTATAVLDAVRGAVEPFGSAGNRWLAKAARG